MKQAIERTGVILAAGFGSRLAGTVASTRLKPLTPVGGKPLMIRTLQSLERAGCRHVVIVLGYESDRIQKELLKNHSGNQKLSFAINPYYDLQNGLSLAAAADYLTGDFVLTMADHVFSDRVMLLAGSHEPPDGGATLLVDYRIDSIFDLDDATKVETDKRGNILRIGKKLSGYDAVDTGLFIGTRGMLSEAQRLFDRNGDASLSEVVQELAQKGKMKALDIGEGFWQDVDTPEMLRHAEKVLTGRPQ